jgi:glycosyltransferase involved in cell wall biosynthesis
LNAERFLELTLRSIWGERSRSIEIDHVIIDGGSADATLEIASHYPSRAISSPDDQGMYDAVNRGLGLVEGEILAYMNADDEITQGALRVIAHAFATNPSAGWLCGRVEYIDVDGEVLGSMKPVPLTLASYVGLGWSCIPQQTVWFRRSFWDRIGPFDIAYRNCGDYDWYARALRVQHPLMLSETLGRFRLHPAQLSLDPQKMARESRMVQERNGGRTFARAVKGRFLSLRLNARNPAWLVAKKRGRIRFTP